MRSSIGLIVALIVMVVTGLVIWKPVQFYWFGQWMGDYEGARYLHFFAMAAVAPAQTLRWKLSPDLSPVG